VSSENKTARDHLILALLDAFQGLSTTAIYFHQAIAEHLGLNQTDHKCLSLLQKHGPLTAGELAERLHVTTGAVTGVIDRLEKADYVRRIKDPTDRRRLIIEPIPKKGKEISKIFRSLDEATTRALNKYTEKELEVILDCVSQMKEMSQGFIKTLRQGEHN
jgi:DNA-binding MarR family transcriptional regulator